MLEIMYNAWYTDNSNIGMKSMNTILDKMEEAGMLPPDNGTQDRDDFGFRWEEEDKGDVDEKN